MEDNVRNYIKYGIHKILHLAYHKKRYSVPDLIEILEIVLHFSNFSAYCHPIAIHGHFLQEGLIEIEELPYAPRDSKGNYLTPKRLPNRPFQSALKLDRILPENVPVLVLWTQIMRNFMHNEKSAQFSLSQNYLIFTQCLSFLSKVDADGNLNDDHKTQLKDTFYSFLYKTLEYPSLRDYFLNDPDLINWVFILIDSANNFVDYTRSYRVLELLSSNPEFSKYVADKKQIHDYVYKKMVALIYPTERSSIETFLFADQQQQRLFSQLLSKIFHALTATKENISAIIEVLKMTHTDILLRFFLFAAMARDQTSAVYITFAILNILKSDEYEFPSYASKIGLFLVSSLVRKDDFMLMLLLRILKYIRFEPAEKEYIFQLLLTAENPERMQITISDIDLFTYKQNPIWNQRTQTIVANLVRQDEESDEESDEDDSEDESDSISEPDKSREEKMFRQSKNVKMLDSGEENKQEQKKDGDQEKIVKDDDFYYKKRKFKHSQYARKIHYDFLNDKGQEFLFIRHCDGVCPYCNHIKGLFALDHQEFLKFSLKELAKDGEISEFGQADLILSIFQTVFDLTFGEDTSFIYRCLIPKYCKFLTSDALPQKFRFPILLYLSHILINFPKGIQILYSVSFFIYAEDFISDFLANFDLASFKKEKALQKLKVVVPKKPKEIPQEQTPNQSSKNSKDKKKNQQPNNSNPPQPDTDLDMEFEEIEINALGVVLWDSTRNCYMQIPKELNDNYEKELEKDNQDEITDNGKYSKYFWRLHLLYHTFKVLLETVRRHSKASKQILLSQLEHFMEQIKDTTIIFLRYTEKMIPTAPFHHYTECWLEIRNLMTETLGVLQEIQFILISRFPKFSNSLFKIFDTSYDTLSNYISLIGKLPTLDSTIALVSTLLLYFNLEAPGVIKRKEKNQPLIEICKKFFENITREFSRVRPAINSVLNSNEKDLTSLHIVNKRVVLNALKLGLSAMQTLNLLISKKRLPIEEVYENSLNEYFATVTTIMKISRVLYIKTRAKRQSLEDNVYMGDQKVNEDSRLNVINEDQELFDKFISICGMNIWQFAHHSRSSTIMIKHGIIPFVLKYIPKMNLDRDTHFSFFAGFHDICYNERSLNPIIKNYPEFPEDMIKLLTSSRDLQRVLLIPLLRGLRIGLGSDTKVAQEFRGLIHFLREVITEDHNHIELSSIIKPQTKQTIDDESLMDALELDDGKGKGKVGMRMENFAEALGIIDEHPASTSIHRKIHGKFDRKITQGDEAKQEKLLQKEARLLLKIIGVTNKIELTQGIKSMNNPRNRVVEGAGLLSDNTTDLLFADQKKKEVFGMQEHVKKKLGDSNFSMLIGNSLPFNATRDYNNMLPPTKQPNFKVYDSLDVGIASFRAQRDLDRVLVKSMNFEDGKGLKANSTRRDFSLKQDKIVSWKTLPDEANRNGTNKGKTEGTVSKNSSILRENARNILQLVDKEYAKLIAEQ